MGFDMDTIKRSEVAKLIGTSTGNIQRLESLGDFPKRVVKGRPGSPALYCLHEVQQWILTRRRSAERQPQTLWLCRTHTLKVKRSQQLKGP